MPLVASGNLRIGMPQPGLHQRPGVTAQQADRRVAPSKSSPCVNRRNAAGDEHPQPQRVAQHVRVARDRDPCRVQRRLAPVKDGLHESVLHPPDLPIGLRPRLLGLLFQESVRERVDDEAFPLLDSPAAVGEHEVHTDAGEGAQDVCGPIEEHPQGLPGVELLAWCVSTSCANVFRLHVHSQLVQDQPLAGLGTRAYRVAFVLVITARWHSSSVP